ncbi:helix-turn-helix domain-containing protein [Nocardia fusca]|uniref:helix-turn-helix domain-containing protein n=1 Tax=Nocardia fusca TaxID=941183 RepID=UPI003794C313
MAGELRTPGPGANIALLRKQRDISQVQLARRARISVSLLSKIEVGDRALSQGVAASLAQAMGTTLDEVLGSTTVKRADEAVLGDLRSAIRRFDLPDDAPVDRSGLVRGLNELVELRGDANLSEVLRVLPGLLADATDYAHHSGTPESWAMVSQVYSAVYWLAARNRWMDLADLAVMKQKVAAERADPLTMAVSSRDEAGTFLNSGDFSGGLAVVDRAITRAESTSSGRRQALSLGLLHLRGMTLAGRAGDKPEAERHRMGAWRVAEEFSEDVNVGGIHFGPENTAVHAVATAMDLENHREAIDIAQELDRQRLTLPATRLGPLHMNIARARLASRDRDGALSSLAAAWDIAPQMAKVHPTSQELLRVLISLHKRSNPTLSRMAKNAGLPF